MPFTFSHPASVIPLAKRGWPLSPLVVGSMAPDFLYFLHPSTKHQFGHTLPGLFLFCLPVGLLVLGLFHILLKWPLLWLLPSAHQERLAPVASGFQFLPWPRLLFIIVALLLGAISHIAWDAFTHSDSWATGYLPWLELTIGHGLIHPVPVYKCLQQISTILGVGLMLFWYWQWFQATAPHPERVPASPIQANRWRVVGLLLLGVILGAMAFSGWRAFIPLPPEDRHFVRDVIISGIGTLFLELVAFSLIWHRFRRCERLA